ncbi:MAG: HAMP domain-containing sensor histidine kinase, partial [Chloroflexota bacterium]
DELGELARTFDEMLASLDAAHGLQQRFVADASHELRTPLATIQGNAEILDAAEASPEERAEAMTQIRRESGRLARLVDDLLVLARADAGAEPLRAQEVPLDEVLMEAFEELRPAAGRRLRVTALEGAIVRGERDRLKQLALILLDNALRYTPGDGQVEVALSVEGGSAVVRIDDEGVGVTPVVVARAFERFYRGEDARRIDPSGTGLGLPIARWIVERHGGAIELAAGPTRGTRVLVRIPVSGGARTAAVRAG